MHRILAVVGVALLAAVPALPSGEGLWGEPCPSDGSPLAQPCRWEAAFPGSYPRAMVAAPEHGQVYAAGADQGPRLAVVAYDASTGEVRWSSTWEGAGPAWPSAFLAASPDTLFAGWVHIERVEGQRTYTRYLRALEPADGTPRWTVRFDGDLAADEWPTRNMVLAALPEHGLVLAAATVPGAGGGDARVWALDALTGEVRWARQHASPDGILDVPVGLHASRAGVRVLMDERATRWTHGFWESRAAVVSLASGDGALLWNRTHDFPGELYPSGLLGSADGARLFVTGGSLLALDGQGNLRWQGSSAPVAAFDEARDRLYLARGATAFFAEGAQVWAYNATHGGLAWTSGYYGSYTAGSCSLINYLGPVDLVVAEDGTVAMLYNHCSRGGILAYGALGVVRAHTGMPTLSWRLASSGDALVVLSDKVRSYALEPAAVVG